MQRFDLINLLNRKKFNGAANYLEIGIADPKDCFNRISTPNKTGVDPGYEYAYSTDRPEFHMTSDEFFQKLNLGQTRFDKDHKWDIIFIDGLHLAHQVYRDVINSLNHINPNGYIVLHDCNPANWKVAHSDLEYRYKHGFHEEWNGTTWKALYFLRTHLDQLVQTINTDYGLGVITMNRTGNKINNFNPFFDFYIMQVERKTSLGLISIQEFLEEHQLLNKPS